ncbi:MAG: hypothetical protein ABIN69_06395 [Aestuariivirga sp.]
MNISKIAIIAASLVTLSSMSAMASSRNAFEECSFDAKYCDSGSKVSTEIVTRHGKSSQVNNVWSADQNTINTSELPFARTGHDSPY